MKFNNKGFTPKQLTQLEELITKVTKKEMTEFQQTLYGYLDEIYMSVTKHEDEKQIQSDAFTTYTDSPINAYFISKKKLHLAKKDRKEHTKYTYVKGITNEIHHKNCHVYYCKIQNKKDFWGKITESVPKYINRLSQYVPIDYIIIRDLISGKCVKLSINLKEDDSINAKSLLSQLIYSKDPNILKGV